MAGKNYLDTFWGSKLEPADRNYGAWWGGKSGRKQRDKELQAQIDAITGKKKKILLDRIKKAQSIKNSISQ